MTHNKLLYLVSILLILHGSLHAQQERNVSSEIDLKNEKFVDIKSKIEETLSEMKMSDDEEFREKSESVRQWLSENEGRLNSDGKMFNYHAHNFKEFLNLKNENNESRMPMGGLWYPKVVNSVQSSSSYRTGLGRINCLAFDPINSNVLYAGSATGGLWKSVNNGINFSCITNNIPNLGVNCIAIHPTNSNKIYMASGEANPSIRFGVNTLASIGLFVTEDGGANWMLTGLQFNLNSLQVINRVRISPINNNIIVVTSTNGIHYSSDAGLTFIQVLPSSIGRGFEDLEFLPGESICYATQGSRLYRSVDSGLNWVEVPAANFSPATQPINSGRIELAVAPSEGNVLYAIYRRTGSSASSTWDSLFVSLNAKTTFNFLFRTATLPILNYQSGFSDALAVSPTSSLVAYAGDGAIVKSTNLGSTWTKVAHYLDPQSTFVHEDVHDILCRGANEVFAATDGGLFKSNDAGSTWTHIGQDLNVAEYQGFGGIQSDPNFFAGGTWHNGWQKYDGGITYRISCCDQGDAVIHPNNSDTIFLVQGFNSIGLERTIDGGLTWSDITPSTGCNCSDTLRSGNVKIFHMNSQRPASVYMLYRNLWVNYNNGTGAWTQINTGITTPARAFAQSPSDTSRIYAVFGDKVYMTLNYTNSPWISLYTYIGSERISDITVNPNNPDEFYFVFNGYSQNAKVYKGVWNGSTNSASISVFSANLPNVPVYRVIFQNTGTQGIYIGTDLGVFFRALNAPSWVEFNNGLPYVKVTDMEINYPNGLISIATFGRGLWQSPLFDFCPADYNHGPILFNPPIYGSEYFEASNSITSARKIQGGYGTNVTYNAGNFSQLNPGFEVIAGSEFRAYVNGCPVLSPILLDGIFVGYMADEKSTIEFVAEVRSKLKRQEIEIIPNPASIKTKVFFELHGESFIEINLFDQHGKPVKQIMKTKLFGNGISSVNVDLTGLATGVYFCKFSSDEFNTTAKLVVVE